MKRIRALTQEERSLWAEVARSIEPSRHRDAPGPPEAMPPDEPQSSREQRTILAAARPPVPKPAPPKAPTPPPLAAIEKRLRQKLSRGQRSVDAKIDLHGLRQDEAHAALQQFLARAHAGGAALVLVVTGKGGRKPVEERGADYGEAPRGVLHRLVPIWLSDPSTRRFVIGFEPASQQHGGSGALYVRIRKAR